jgi:hypothetical protein
MSVRLSNSDFNKNFNRTSRMINITTIITFILSFSIIVSTIIGMVYLGYNIFTDPEGVGEFFGKIVKGFNGK